MRISMTLPDEIIYEIDEVLKKEGYNSRSKGIAYVLNEYIINHKSKKISETNLKSAF